MIIIILCLCALFVYWLQDRIYRKYWDRKLSASVEFQKEPVYEGQTAYMTETVANAGHLPLVMLHMKFQTDRKLQYTKEEHASVSDKCYKHDIFTLMPMKKVIRTMPVKCNGRGYFEINSFDLTTGNLFLTNRFVSVRNQHTGLYVFPKQISTEELEIPFRSLMGSVITKRMTNEDPFEFRGLRDYQPYDPIKSINWKATARAGHPMVNVYDYTAGQELRIIVNLEDETHWREYLLLESSLRIASSLAARFIAYSVPVSIMTTGRDAVNGDNHMISGGSSQDHLRSINEMLARIDLEQPQIPVVDLLQEEINNDNAGNQQITYLLIGYSQREDLHQMFSELTRSHPGSLWLLPLLPEMEVRLGGSANFEMQKWEVHRSEK